MTEIEATAEIFWTAFRVLSREEQHAVLRRMISNQKLRHDLIDLALIEERQSESERPLRDLLTELDG